jgi:hypothetical protein
MLEINLGQQRAAQLEEEAQLESNVDEEQRQAYDNQQEYSGSLHLVLVLPARNGRTAQNSLEKKDCSALKHSNKYLCKKGDHRSAETLARLW